MTVERDDWGQRIKAVERQFKTARLAIDRLRADVQADVSIAIRFPDALSVKDAWDDLALTYLIRMFAVFENGLRSYWWTQKPGKDPKMEPLMNAIGSRRRIPHEILQEAHGVRDYRNQIVHQKKRGEVLIAIPMDEARRRLSMFFDRLPFQW